MNQKWKDAIGDIDEKYIDEYASHQKKAVWKRWIPYEILAACALLALVFGIWKFENRHTKPNQPDAISANKETHTSFPPEMKESKAPLASETATKQPPSESLQPTEQAVQDQTRETVEEVRDHKNNKQKNEGTVTASNEDALGDDFMGNPSDSDTTQDGPQSTDYPQNPSVPDEQPTEQPTEKPDENVVWNTVSAMAEPYGGRLSDVLNWYDVSYSEPPVLNPAVKPASSYEPLPTSMGYPTQGEPSMATEPQGGNSSNSSNFKPSEEYLKLKKQLGDKWLIYDEREQSYTVDRTVIEPNEVYLKLHSHDITLFVAEIKTSKTTLVQADAEDENSIFGIGSIISKVNGVETYFMEDSQGKMCARFYKDGILVTAWSCNGKKEQMFGFIYSMTK